MLKLHHSKSGQGPNLVLLHGWGSSSKVWQDVAGELGKRFQVWCIDLPGHGDSHAVRWDCSTEQGVQLLAEVMPPTGTVVGWSLGGLMAQLYARQFPQRVTGLMLVSSAPRFTAARQWPHGMAHETLSGFSRQYAKAPQQTLQKFCALQVLNSEYATRTLSVLRDSLSGLPCHAEKIRWGLHWLEQVDLCADAGLGAVPVKLLHGEEDQVLSVKTAEDTARIWRHVEVERVVQAGHAPFVSHPGRFLRWMDRCTNDE